MYKIIHIMLFTSQTISVCLHRYMLFVYIALIAPVDNFDVAINYGIYI